MTRHIEPGETIPLEVFPGVLRDRAQYIGREALLSGLVIPPAVFQMLDASDEDLRIVQLRNMFTYAEIARLAEELANPLSDSRLC
jgi:hypothetical protein